jgi:hypothetical protein
MAKTPSGRNAQAGIIFFAIIALLVIGSHYPLWGMPYFWDELGQFVPAALDLWQHGAWVPTSTLPNIHPPGIPLWLASIWTITGHSIVVTRISMLLLASVGAFLAFLLTLRLSGGVPGLPGFAVLVLLLLNPLFYTQSMMAQLDMPAMVLTLLAIYLFVEERLLLAVAACTALVWVKETGIVLPVVMGALLLKEQRRQEAWLFAIPCLSLIPWLLTLWKSTGSIFGNREFAAYNLSYPLHPSRLTVAFLRRGYELFFNHGYLLGALPLAVLWKRIDVFRRREWKLLFWFVVLHVTAVTVTGGAVLERYLLPVLPIVLIAFSVTWSHMAKGWRVGLPMAAAVISVSGFFMPSTFPQPHENNLSMVRLVDLFRVVSREMERRQDTRIATAWPLSDALRRPDFGYVRTPLNVIPMANFSEAELERISAEQPDLFIWYSRDSLYRSWIFDSVPALAEWRANLYGFREEDDSIFIEEALGMREVSRLSVGNQSIAIFRRGQSGQ